MPFKPQPRPKVTQPLNESYRYILLTKNQIAVVDVVDYESLNAFTWCAQWNPHTQTFYAARRDGRKKYVYMHRVIAETPSHLETDHRDGNGLNNRRENLRHVTQTQNRGNQRKRSNASSKYKGVSFNKEKRKWEVYIKHSGIQEKLGYFMGEEDAARAYDAAALKLFGKFAHLNFPQKLTTVVVPSEVEN